MLFPIGWPGPFGLVMIEALACDTPVSAWRRGSVPEVNADGVTGFAVESVEEAVAAVGRVAGLSRHACREVFEERFDAARMVLDNVDGRIRTGGQRPPVPDPLALMTQHGPDRRRALVRRHLYWCPGLRRIA